MVGNLLLRGMLVGLAAGLLCFVFLRVMGEPSIGGAIAFEEAGAATAPAFGHEHAAPAAGNEAVAEPAGHDHGGGEELVSRPTQAGLGLLTAVIVYGTALGGLFALAFALVYGRWETLGPRGTAALLAAAGFVALYLVPFFKYPPNPPAVGSPDTIGMRTSLYVAMLALSLAGMIAAAALRGRLVPSQGRWNASLCAGGTYLVGMLVVGVLLPGIHEIPEAFPAATLWSFRVASLGGQAILWSTIGIGFGLLSHRVALREPGARLDVAVV
ncbi:MAG: CbtA family protein [Amaricoccus sp.]